jgi:hypothetical protein
MVECDAAHPNPAPASSGIGLSCLTVPLRKRHCLPKTRVLIHNAPVMVLRLTRAAIAAVAGSVVTLAQLNLPSEQFWERIVAMQWAAVVAAALLLCYDAVRSVNQVARYGRTREYDNNLRAAMSATVAMIVNTFGTPWDELTVQYYRARRFLWWRRLVRVGGIRAGASSEDLQRGVRPSFGLVGAAYSELVIIAEQWQDFVRNATKQGPEAWAGRNARDRYGLSWGQLRRLPRPEGVVASPTFDFKGRPDGCVQVAGPLKLADLTSDAMRQVLDDLATVLDRLGPPPAGWWGTHER